MKKIYFIFLLLTAASFYSKSQGIINGVSLHKQKIGSASNIVGIENGAMSLLDVNAATNTIAFIHRNDATVFPNFNTGNYRFDISYNLGNTWSVNNGPVNNSSRLATGYCNARFPQCAIYNPAGNTIADSAYLIYSGSWDNDPGTNTGQWMGQITGRGKLSGDTSTFNVHIDTVNNGNVSTPQSFCQGAPGVFWNVTTNYTGTFASTSNQLISGLVVMQGTWNNSTKDVVWTTQNLSAMFQQANYGYVVSQAFAPVIAFDPSGNNGWVACLGSLVGSDSTVLNPIFWKTTNGGSTWSGPFIAHLDSLPGVVNRLSTTAYAGQPLAQVPTTAFEAKLTVDYLGNPHLLTTVGNTGPTGTYSIDVAPYFIYDITYNTSNCVSNWNGWSANLVSNCATFMGTYTTDSIIEQNRPLVSRSADGTKLFFYWLDSDNSLSGGGGLNDAPNLFTRAYDLTNNMSTLVINLTLGDSLFGGQTSTVAGGLFKIGANFPVVSQTAIQNGNNYTVPLVLTQIDYTDYPNGGTMGISTNPVNFFYISNITYAPSDFIQSAGVSIALIGHDTIYHQQTFPYYDLGATVVYNDTTCYPTPNLHIVVNSSDVNINGEGYYTVYYYAEDSAGNIYATTTRTVYIEVVGDEPDATTTAATNITSIGATLNGIIDGDAIYTYGVFRYGLTNAYGYSVATNPDSTLSNGRAVSANISGLFPNTLYHFMLMDSSISGFAYGADLTFTTGAGANVCTPAVGDTGLIGPDASLVPCIVQGQNFSQTFTIQVPSVLTYGTNVIAVDSITLDSVQNLPAGLAWSPNKAPATYHAGSSGCFQVYGNTEAPCGQYYMRIVATVYIHSIGPVVASVDFFTGSSEYLRVVAPGNSCQAVNRQQTTAYVPYATCTAASVSVTTTQTNLSCYQSFNGNATAIPSGGSSYTYQWSNGATTATITGLGAGTYHVTVTSNGISASASVTITQPSQLSLSFSSAVSACTSNTGAASVSVHGGTLNYTYLWSNLSTTNSISSVAAGTYAVTVEDGHNCSVSGTVYVGNPSAFSLQTTGTNTTCYNGSDGTATTVASGGISPFTYLWSTSATTESISNLAVGVYYVTVQDANGCSQFDSAVVVSGTNVPLLVTATSTPTSCGSNAGSASALVSGNTGVISYIWNNGGQTATVSNLAQGLYIVTVSSNGCSATAETNVNSTASYNVSADSVNVTCYGASTGSAGVLVNGGTGNITYAWNTGASTSTINNLAAGIYTVTITDGSGCSKAIQINISQPAIPLSVSTSSTSSTCGNSTGSASASVTGNTGSVSYMWSNSSSSPLINNLAQGIYSVTVTSGGCSATASAIVNNTNGPSVTVLQTDPTCFNSANGSAILVVSGGTSPYSYTWSNASTASSITGLGQGTYTVIVTDASNCQATKAVTLTQPDAITFNPAIADVNCYGDNTGSISLSVSGGTSPYGYNWSNSSASSAINSLTAGSYSVTVTDSKGCSASSTNQITQPSSALSLTTSSTGSNINTGSATCNASGGTTPYTYSWSNGQSTATISGLPSGTLSVTVTDSKNCTATASVTVNPLSINNVNNAISSVSLFPNPANDIVHVVVELSTPQALQFSVFDVTGRLINTHIESSTSSINYDLDVTTLASGVYVMEITAGDNSVRKRFVITR